MICHFFSFLNDVSRNSSKSSLLTPLGGLHLRGLSLWFLQVEFRVFSFEPFKTDHISTTLPKFYRKYASFTTYVLMIQKSREAAVVFGSFIL